MKKVLFNLTLGASLALFLLVSCKPAQSVVDPPSAPPTADVEDQYKGTPCSGPRCLSDTAYIRFSAVGESMDEMMAKQKAMSNARAGIAAEMKTGIEGMISSYSKSMEMQNVEEIQERFESYTQETIKQTLTGSRAICETMIQTEDKKYKCYVCMEQPKQDLLTALKDAAMKDERLKVDFNYEMFKKTFEKSMMKIE